MIPWDRGGARWLVAGGLSLAAHAVILVGFYAMSGDSEGPSTPPSEPARGAQESPAPVTETPVESPSTEKPVSVPEPEREEKPAPPPKAVPVNRPVPKAPPPSPQAGEGSLAQITSQEPLPEPVVRSKPVAPKPPVKAETKPAETKPVEAKGAKTIVYVVKKGDNLTKVARDAGTTPGELAKLNGKTLRALANLKVGQKIRIPVKD